jgi:GSH-dependent disulfide-bond oxidoreductase
MIDFYTWQTSNGQRVAILLEECGFPYRVHKIDLSKGEQQSPEYLAINTAGAIPAIVDSDGPGGKPLTLAQSAAIDLYLAEKAGKFIPADPGRRALAHQWLLFALSDCAPASTAIFFQSTFLPDKSPANLKWHEERLLRFFRIADGRLAGRDYLADELSIADFALFPVVIARTTLVDAAGNLPDLARWSAALAARPAVARAMHAAD